MKLLFTQDALVNAGAERSHLEILSRFSSDMEVGFVYFYPKHDLKKAYQDAGIRLHFLDIPESYSFGTAIVRLVRLIRKEKPDLLVSSLYRADIITRFAALITGVPLVGTLVNDSYSPIAWTDKKGLKYKLVYWLDRLTSGIPVHWIANAKSIAKSHVRTLRIKEEKISIIYRGRSVPATFWKPVGEIRKFISYGRLLERKGFQELILAFSEVVKRYPDSTLTIYGEGVFRKNLEDLVLSLNLQTHVKLPGRVANPTDLLPTAHCFLFPSWYEGFSGALVEAMMAGIPIIASDIPMNLEAVTADKNALIFPVKNVESLTQKMLFSIENSDRMAELGTAARVEAIERFDIEKIAKEYEIVLKNLFLGI
jgi:glycosyltransferase involved in cell wall biosynthesis